MEILKASAVFILYILWVMVCYLIAYMLFVLIFNWFFQLTMRSTVHYDARHGWYVRS